MLSAGTDLKYLKPEDLGAWLTLPSLLHGTLFSTSVVFLLLKFSYLFIYLFSLGHGGSDGLHAYVHSLDDAVNDMVWFEVHLQGADDTVIK